MWSLIPYFIYLLFLYFLVDKLRLVPALVSAALVWASAAGVLVFLWTKIRAWKAPIDCGRNYEKWLWEIEESKPKITFLLFNQRRDRGVGPFIKLRSGYRFYTQDSHCIFQKGRYLPSPGLMR